MLRRDPVEHGRRVERAAAHIADQQAGAGRHRLVHHRLEPPRRWLVDHRAHIHLWIEGIAVLDGACLLDEQLDEAIGHAVLDQHALDGGASLARILVRPVRRERRCLFEVRVLEHDDRIVAAEFQNLALVDGLGGNVLADRYAAREGDEVDVRTGQEFIGDFGRIARQNREHFRRQSRLVQDVGERKGGERGFLARLEHDSIVGGHRGSHFVNHLIQADG